MARVIVGDQLLPAKVVFVSHHLQIWIVADVYKLFVGDQSLSVTDEEADELAADIQNLSPQDLEAKWLLIAPGVSRSTATR
jgi:hypothetical protein